MGEFAIFKIESINIQIDITPANLSALWQTRCQNLQHNSTNLLSILIFWLKINFLMKIASLLTRKILFLPSLWIYDIWIKYSCRVLIGALQALQFAGLSLSCLHASNGIQELYFIKQHISEIVAKHHMKTIYRV